MSIVTGTCTLLAALVCLTSGAPAARAADLPYSAAFDGANGSAWPAPWFPGSSHVTIWDLQSNRARLNGDTGFVARMILPGFAESDVEVLVTCEFEDVHHQGFGFYVRQNGGTLQEYIPHGQGYAMFLKGAWAWPEDLGLWREIDGVETQFAWGNNPIGAGLVNGVRYRLRFRVTQQDAGTTRLQARVWPEASSEPAAWTIDATDARAELPGTLGSFAIDIYNHAGAGNIYLDDLQIHRFPEPTGVSDPAGGPALGLSLPRPHPIAGAAEITLALPERAMTRLSVHDASGRLVSRPIDALLGPGDAVVAWNPAGRAEGRLAPGVYFLRLESGARRAARRVIVIE